METLVLVTEKSGREVKRLVQQLLGRELVVAVHKVSPVISFKKVEKKVQRVVAQQLWLVVAVENLDTLRGVLEKFDPAASVVLGGK